MAASKTLEMILDQVKMSNLNFHIQHSPFSAIISIKSTFVKNKEGVSLNPNTCLIEPTSEKLEKLLEVKLKAWTAKQETCKETQWYEWIIRKN